MSFPTSLPDLSGTYTNDTVQKDIHPPLHNVLNQELLAGLTKIGIDSSTDPDSLDYRITQIEVGTAVPTGVISMWGGSDAPTGYLLCDGSAVDRDTYSGLFAIIGTTYGEGDGSITFNVPDFRDRVAIGASASISRNEKGGAETIDLYHTHTTPDHTLTTAEIPAHTHTQDAHTHTQNAHTHTQNAHTHTQDAHGHTQDSHTHTAPGTNFITDNTGGAAANVTTGGGGYQLDSTTDGTVATNQNTTATNQNATATNQNATATNQNATATNQNTGGGGAHNHGATGDALSAVQSVMNPYIGINFIIKT